MDAWHGCAMFGMSGFFGGTIAIAAVGFGRWRSTEPKVWRRAFWLEFCCLTGLLSPLLMVGTIGIIGSWASVSGPNSDTVVGWWQAAFAIDVVLCMITIVYHMPRNLRIRAGEDMSEMQIIKIRDEWVFAHIPRVILCGLSAICAFIAVSKGLE
eukprot:6176254-Pleurochrysis_carterae.AAC.2